MGCLIIIYLQHYCKLNSKHTDCTLGSSLFFNFCLSKLVVKIQAKLAFIIIAFRDTLSSNTFIKQLVHPRYIHVHIDFFLSVNNTVHQLIMIMIMIMIIIEMMYIKYDTNHKCIYRASDITRWCDFAQSTENRTIPHNLEKSHNS